MVFQRISERTLLVSAGLLFTVSAVSAVIWCRCMSEMGSMPMPGGWEMSMAWMRMPGQTWAGVTTSFLGMWVVMMIAMMLPSATSMMRRYLRIVEKQDLRKAEQPNPLTLILALAIGYFAVWTVLGAIVFGLGITLAELEIQYPNLARLMPMLAAMCVALAGCVQLTPWKARHLSSCRQSPKPERVVVSTAAAWRQGFLYGLHCTCSCLSLTAILIVLGAMNILSMALVTAAITLERLAPNGVVIARIVGVIALGIGTPLFLRAMGII